METSTLIKKVHMDCPLCGKTHEVEERKRFATLIVKGEEVTYEERFYFCANADENENEFETGTMTNTNLLNARNAYRVKRGLLTSDEIVAIRENQDCLDGERLQYQDMRVKRFRMRLMIRCFVLLRIIR